MTVFLQICQESQKCQSSCTSLLQEACLQSFLPRALWRLHQTSLQLVPVEKKLVRAQIIREKIAERMQ